MFWAGSSVISQWQSASRNSGSSPPSSAWAPCVANFLQLPLPSRAGAAASVHPNDEEEGPKAWVFSLISTDFESGFDGLWTKGNIKKVAMCKDIWVGEEGEGRKREEEKNLFFTRVKKWTFETFLTSLSFLSKFFQVCAWICCSWKTAIAWPHQDLCWVPVMFEKLFFEMSSVTSLILFGNNWAPWYLSFFPKNPCSFLLISLPIHVCILLSRITTETHLSGFF